MHDWWSKTCKRGVDSEVILYLRVEKGVPPVFCKMVGPVCNNVVLTNSLTPQKFCLRAAVRCKEVPWLLFDLQASLLFTYWSCKLIRNEGIFPGHNQLRMRSLTWLWIHPILQVCQDTITSSSCPQAVLIPQAAIHLPQDFTMIRFQRSPSTWSG